MLDLYRNDPEYQLFYQEHKRKWEEKKKQMAIEQERKQEREKKRRKMEKKQEKVSEKKRLEKRAKMLCRDPMMMPEYIRLIEKEKQKITGKKVETSNSRKKAKNSNPRKELPKRAQNLHDLDPKLEEEKLAKLLEVREEAPVGIRGLGEGGKRKEED